MPFPRRAACLAIAGAVLSVALPAAGQRLSQNGPGPSDPLMQYADDMSSPDTFYLTSGNDVEVVRFHKAHDMAICAASAAQNQAQNQNGAAARGYPLIVTWDQDTATVQPGNCLYLDAARVRVRSAVPIPQDVTLAGHVMILN